MVHCGTEFDCVQTDAAGQPDPFGPNTRFDPAQWPGRTRGEEINQTLANAHADSRFRDHVERADAARDNGDWPLAESEYGSALRLYPLHWGYAIQFAHAAKEQALFARAEAWYRSAVALGAPPDMVDEHLGFVARLNGADFVRDGMPDLAVPPLRAPPTVADIRLIAELLGIRGPGEDAEQVEMLRRMPTCRDVLVALIGHHETLRGSRSFLEILHG